MMRMLKRNPRVVTIKPMKRYKRKLKHCYIGTIASPNSVDFVPTFEEINGNVSIHGAYEGILIHGEREDAERTVDVLEHEVIHQVLSRLESVGTSVEFDNIPFAHEKTNGYKEAFEIFEKKTNAGSNP